MPARNGSVHVATTTRAYKDKVYRTHLLRRSYREDGKVKNETLGNLSHLPEPLIDIIRRSLQGQTFVPLADAFEITRSRAHGHVQAVSVALARLGLASVLATQPCRERDLVLAMVASRILDPDTKLATSRRWHTTTLAEDFGVADADEDDLYAAMDWLLARQDATQAKLAARHLSAGGLVLYDLSSSYFEGSTCPLARRGYSRDGKPGTLQVNYGLLTEARGCPVAVSVFEGNTADSKTVMPTVQRVREDFGLQQVVMVGDRGMRAVVSRQKAIDELRESDGMGWITALKSVSIRALVEQGQLQLSLFDQRKLLELDGVARLPRRAPGGVPQRRPGQATRAQARRTAQGHRGQPAGGQGQRGCSQAQRAIQDRPARGQDRQQVQGGQALRADHHRHVAGLGASAGQHRR